MIELSENRLPNKVDEKTALKTTDLELKLQNHLYF